MSFTISAFVMIFHNDQIGQFMTTGSGGNLDINREKLFLQIDKINKYEIIMMI